MVSKNDGTVHTCSRVVHRLRLLRLQSESYLVGSGYVPRKRSICTLLDVYCELQYHSTTRPVSKLLE